MADLQNGVADEHGHQILGCKECQLSEPLGFDFTFAFQPIVEFTKQSIYAHEALVRGINDEPTYWVLSQITDCNRYHFDQSCRVKAVQLAASLGMETLLSINFLPNAVYNPTACIQTTLKAAKSSQFPLERIIFEVTENERLRDNAHLVNIFREYRRFNFLTAIDDFGAVTQD